jgi:hypothetical protein
MLENMIIIYSLIASECEDSEVYVCVYSLYIQSRVLGNGNKFNSMMFALFF